MIRAFYTGERWAFYIALASVLPIALVLSLPPRFSPDSYAYFLLGESIWAGNGYTTSALRDLYTGQLEGPWTSRSFPPAWPVLVGAATSVFGTGGAVWLAILFLIGSVGTTLSICWHLTGKVAWSAILVTALLYSQMPYLDEVAAARAIPAAWFFLQFGVLMVILAGGTNNAGVWAGAAFAVAGLARFDLVPVVLLLMGGLFLMSRSTLKLQKQWGAGATVFLAISGMWWIRNLLVFGSPLAADSSLSLWALSTGIAQSTWPAGLTLAADPLTWAVNRMPALHFGIVSWLNPNTGGLTILAMLALIAGWARLSVNRKLLASGLMLGAVGLVLLAGLAGYSSPRYAFIPAGLAMLAGGLAYTGIHDARLRVVLPLCAIAMLLITVPSSVLRPGEYGTPSPAWQDAQRYSPGLVAETERFTRLMGRPPVIAADHAESLSFTSGLVTVQLPVNMKGSPPSPEFLNQFKADLVVTKFPAKNPTCLIRRLPSSTYLLDSACLAIPL